MCGVILILVIVVLEEDIFLCFMIYIFANNTTMHDGDERVRVDDWARQKKVGSACPSFVSKMENTQDFFFLASPRCHSKTNACHYATLSTK